MIGRLVGIMGVLVACADSGSHAAAREGAEPLRPVAAADTDDFGAPLPTDAQFAARVVSLNPTTTELIFALGAQSRLVARSKWDTFPAEANRIPDIGDGIRPNIEAIVAARPTLVLLYATPDNRAAADALRRVGIRTIALRVDRMAQWHRLVEQLGVALGAPSSARVVRDSVQRTLDRVRTLTADMTQRPTVVWPVWDTPPMVIGGGSYLDELLTIAGGVNVFHDRPEPSLTVSMEDVVRRAPAYVVASAQQLEQLRTRTGWVALPAVRNRQFVVDNPEVTGRPSVTMGMAAVQLARALHPQLAAALP